MLEHYLLLGLLAGVGALFICSIVYWIFKRFENPFDNLDESDLSDLDKIGSSLSNFGGDNMNT